MRIFEVVMTAAITMSVAAASYAGLDTDALSAQAQTIASAATCHTVDDAIVAYVAARDAVPRTIADLASYVRGDISAYRIEKGRAAGPGCVPVAAP